MLEIDKLFSSAIIEKTITFKPPVYSAISFSDVNSDLYLSLCISWNIIQKNFVANTDTDP